MDFSALGLPAPLLQAIKEQGYDQPFPIQQKAIPAILAGQDILGIARTGSGKTASFVLPLLQQFQKKPAARNRFIKALVLVPTRELALQVANVFHDFSAHLTRRVKTLAVFGGVSINPQMMALSGTEVLVATPGRLLDLVDSNALQLSEVEVLVLDEADKMLNLGFEEEMNRIFALLPSKRQNLLFSATLAEDIQTIKEKLLRDPLVVSVEEQQRDEEQLELIEQVAYRVSTERKGPFLRYLIKQENMQQVLVFVSSGRNADNLVVKLNKNGLKAMAMHGKKSQGARTEALKRFKAGKLRVLVATDLASRGIDVQFLPFVINYELPRSPKDYIHRIGRTGRAGATGKAISLITPEDEHHFKIIQKKMGKNVEMLGSDEVNLQGF
ncbi:ATP-dependent RNA helicase RhlE [Pontibacter ummariensis]|uniref:ATP-dependent RNA helicase RhlE n=1 Tax=Pontibacter ummariensis TaxID=1610492 RepID=A0A239DAU7_9BACT|nr:DEAD/DEAH box helicase [Pontibacter ummariensis]PRY14333.1 ATP-dependent RNA helicase RhlE [Pontibacter ummariensis]SNS29439.1 ATP-dependent RNA helicase RhlE [Pontibacter ummariensis]